MTSTVERTGSKELDELLRQFKKGYTLKKTRGGHYRVLNARGEYVQKPDGKALTLTGTAHGGRAINNMTADLKNAGVLRGTATQRSKSAVSAEERERRSERMKEAVAERTRKATERSDKLRERLTKVLKPVGGVEMPGTQADLAYIASHFSRQNGNPATVDLIQPALSSLLKGNTIGNKYGGLVEKTVEELEKTNGDPDVFFQLVREARGLPQQIVKSKDRKGSLDEADWPFEMRLLEIAALFADNKYQRPPDWPFIRRNAASFDERLVGAIDVSERGRGATFAVLDGQQRMEMMKLVGKHTVWAAVYTGMDVSEEARFFLHKNKDKKAIHPYYTYQARITSGDPDMIEITRIVEQYGYKISIVSAAHDAKNISAIAALEEAYRRKDIDDRETLSRTLRTLKATTFGRPAGQSNSMIRGLAYLLSFFRDEEIDLEHLHAVIADRGVPWITGAAREERMGGHLMGTVARVILDEYNRGLQRSEKLNASRIDPSMQRERRRRLAA